MYAILSSKTLYFMFTIQINNMNKFIEKSSSSLQNMHNTSKSMYVLDYNLDPVL